MKLKHSHKNIIAMAAALLLAIAVIYIVKVCFFSPNNPVVFDIKEGQSGRAVAANLKAQGLIKSETIFLITLRLTADSNSLKAGRFDLNTNMTGIGIINCISSGTCQHYERVVILEGWRIEEIAEALHKQEVTDAKEFVLKAKEQNLEGYLFPTTYLFTYNMPAQRVINTMVSEFNKTVRPVIEAGSDNNKFKKLNLTERQILAIASIVEREAVVHDERPKIAAVYMNRVAISKKLEADPTVQYALGYNLQEGRYWKKGLTLKDLRETNSPYNTYKYKGIPPGPICSPSLASVLAVMNPEPYFDNLYFVADNTGRHVFSKTFNEHVKNIRRIRGSR
ncbi:UPF0755 protein [Parelusimicrobium proximum]|uniref:endolytic transglycosylase MltG n=1 Tax=Parelusimicrobium proximum TaxID=3228953 RepID=UPI003D17AFB4